MPMGKIMPMGKRKSMGELRDVAARTCGRLGEKLGEGIVINTVRVENAGRAFDDSGNLTLDTNFSKIENQIYIEHGLGRQLTFVGSTIQQRIRFDNAAGGQQFTGFGTSEIGLRYEAYNDGKNVI